jgi:hypothetical protein
VPRTAALLLSLVAASSPGADWEGQARAWVGPGFDSNARRDYVSPGTATAADGSLSVLGQLVAGVRADAFTVRGAYDLGGRAFLTLPSEDTLLQDARLTARVELTPWLQVGLAGHARDRRASDRSYTDLQGGLEVAVLPDAHLTVSLSVDAHRFLYWPRFAASHAGPEVTLGARYQVDRRHAVSLSGEFSPRAYNATAAVPPTMPGGPPGSSTVTRRDTCLGAGAAYAYRGPFHLSASYAYFDQASNSYGETLRRHRLGLTAGVGLPWELTLLGQGTLQLSVFPDGVFLSPELSVAEDDENSSSASLKLVRPLGEHLEVDLRYAFYFNQLPSNHFLYLRHVVSVGVALSY